MISFPVRPNRLRLVVSANDVPTIANTISIKGQPLSRTHNNITFNRRGKMPAELPLGKLIIPPPSADSPLFAYKMKRDRSLMWRPSMFPNIDALPRPQCQTTFRHRHRKAHRRKRRADMRWHIVVTFGVVNELWIPVSH